MRTCCKVLLFAVADLFLINGAVSFQTSHNKAIKSSRWVPTQQTAMARLLTKPPPLSTYASAVSKRHVAKTNKQDLVDKPVTRGFSGPVQFLKNCLRLFRSFRTRAAKFAGALLVVFAIHTNAAWAVTGGRMGGSFGQSSRSRSPPVSRSRPSSLPRTRYYHDTGPRIHIHTNPFPSTRMYGSYGTAETYHSPAAKRFSATDIVLLTGTAGLIAYGFANNRRQDGETSPLGPGATVAAVTVCLDIPNRKDPNSILNRLKRLSDQADTSRRESVQKLVAEVALELLRQDTSIVSARTQSDHYSNVGQAERGYQRQSLQSRSKFERESVNKYSGEDTSDRHSSSAGRDDAFLQSTAAVVTLNMAIEGDSTKLPLIHSRSDLASALRRIAADSQVEDCLLSAEILWAPEETSDRLSSDDVYVDYPELVPL